MPCFDRTSEDWMLEVKMFSTMYPQGDEGNVRCQYNTRFLSSDKLAVCIYSRCLQLLFSVIILQMIVTYFICQKRVEESISWQMLGVNRAPQVFKLNLLNSILPNLNSLGSNRARENKYSHAILIPWGVIERGKKDIPALFLFPRYSYYLGTKRLRENKYSHAIQIHKI